MRCGGISGVMKPPKTPHAVRQNQRSDDTAGDRNAVRRSNRKYETAGRSECGAAELVTA